MRFAKVQKPDFGRIIANTILEETKKQKPQHGEDVEGRGKKREREQEQIDFPHTSCVRQGPVPLSRFRSITGACHQRDN